MKVQIRKAKTKDLDSVLHLVRELAIFEKEPKAVTATLEQYHTAFTEGLIDIIVAETGDEIVGMALYYDTFSTWKGKMLYLEDFIVKSAYRSKGIGARIYDAFLEEARRRNCVMVKWQVLYWNEDAISFYKKRGVIIQEEWLNCKLFLGDTQ